MFCIAVQQNYRTCDAVQLLFTFLSLFEEYYINNFAGALFWFKIFPFCNPSIVAQYLYLAGSKFHCSAVVLA